MRDDKVKVHYVGGTEDEDEWIQLKRFVMCISRVQLQRQLGHVLEFLPSSPDAPACAARCHTCALCMRALRFF